MIYHIGLLTLLSFPLITPPAMGWEGQASVDYAKTFVPSDPVMNLGLSLSQRMNKTWGLFLNQNVEKNMVIDSSKDEFEAADTRLGMRLYPRSLIEHVSWVLTVSATLPSSKDSRHNEIYSKPEAKIAGAYQPWTWLSIDGSASVRYYVEKFESAPSQGEDGGEALPDYSLGLSQASSIALGGWAFGYGFDYRETRYHKIEQIAPNNAYTSDLPDQAYNFSLFVSRDLWRGAQISASFSQGSALLQEGWEDYVIFDKEESSYALGFSQTF